jgi:hypothetical protein
LKASLKQLHIDISFIESNKLRGFCFFICLQQLWELNSHFFTI